jgi:hypothetical protein
MSGWIKIHRKILEWEWYSDTNTFRLFMHLLLTATHKEISFRNKKLKAGSLVTSLTKLSEETGLTKREVRTALEKLKTTHEVTHQTTHQNSIITIENWNLYQANDTQSDTQATHSCYNKNIRREEEREYSRTTNNKVVSLTSSLYTAYGTYSNVYLSKVQHSTLTQLMGGEKLLAGFIDELSENIASKREQVFDEKYPSMHFIRLRKYFSAHQNKPKRKEEPANVSRTYNAYG